MAAVWAAKHWRRKWTATRHIKKYDVYNLIYVDQRTLDDRRKKEQHFIFFL